MNGSPAPDKRRPRLPDPPSRQAVVLLPEVRLALLGVDRLGLIEFPYLPTEVAFFADAGAACGTGQDLKLEWARRTTDRVRVFSVGVSTRINMLGSAVLEIYYAYPFQRPERGGHFGFLLAPGW